MYRRTCDVHDEDTKLLKEFLESVKMLAGMAVEIFEDHPAYLLSPVCRQQFVDKAKQVEAMRFRLAPHLATDNPCDPL